MHIVARNNRTVLLRTLEAGDLDALLHYLQQLSEDSRKRFGPHPYDRNAIISFYDQSSHRGYVAITADTHELIAYAIIKNGVLEHDHEWLQAHGLDLNNATDCTFAPSVADQWQSCGIGTALFRYIVDVLAAMRKQRIILWGGVQADNTRAVNYYRKHGFRIVGQFYYNGENYDMVVDIAWNEGRTIIPDLVAVMLQTGRIPFVKTPLRNAEQHVTPDSSGTPAWWRGW